MALPTQSVTRVSVRWNGAVPGLVIPVTCKGTDLTTLLESCTKNLPSRGRKVKMLYTEAGQEVKSMLDCPQESTLWASVGEAFIKPGQEVLSTAKVSAQVIMDLAQFEPAEAEFTEHGEWVKNYIASAPLAILQELCAQVFRKRQEAIIRVFMGAGVAAIDGVNPDVVSVSYEHCAIIVPESCCTKEDELFEKLNVLFKVDWHNRWSQLSTANPKYEQSERAPMVHVAWDSRKPQSALEPGSLFKTGPHADLKVDMSTWMAASKKGVQLDVEDKRRWLAQQTRFFT